MPDLADYNIFAAASSGPTQQLFAKVMAIFGVIILVGLLVGYGIYLLIEMKKYYIVIELYRRIDGQNKLVAKLRAKNYKIGKAGDYLWYIKKLKKYIAPGELQSGPNVYKYFERADGELINFQIGDIDEQFRKAGVKYIHHDMRAQRIAISKSLSAELQSLSFWDKYGATITFIIEILIFGVAVVIIFYQFSEVIATMDQVMGSMNKVVININSLFQNVSAAGGSGGGQPIYIPPV